MIHTDIRRCCRYCHFVFQIISTFTFYSILCVCARGWDVRWGWAQRLCGWHRRTHKWQLDIWSLLSSPLLAPWLNQRQDDVLSSHPGQHNPVTVSKDEMKKWFILNLISYLSLLSNVLILCGMSLIWKIQMSGNQTSPFYPQQSLICYIFQHIL